MTSEVIGIFLVNSMAGAMGGVIQIAWRELKGRKMSTPSSIDKDFAEPLPVEARKRFLSSYGVFAGTFGGVYGWGLLGAFGSGNLPSEAAQLFGAFIVGFVAHRIAELLDSTPLPNMYAWVKGLIGK